MKILLIIIVSITFVNCEKSVNKPSKYSDFNQDQLVNEGIKNYKEKKNEIALEYLNEAINRKDNGKAEYFLANVLMNLKRYDDAIKHYWKAKQLEYENINSVYNIACAYSLKGDYYSTTYYLIDVYAMGDKNNKRVYSDSDLGGFRESRYYEEYSRLIKLVNNGFTPNDNSDFRKYISCLKLNYYPDDDPSPGQFIFKEDNTFYINNNDRYSASPAGEWTIDENKKFIIKLLGEMTSVAHVMNSGYDTFKARTVDKKMKIVTKKEVLSNPRWGKNNELVWVVKYEEPVIDIIEVKNIRMCEIGIIDAPPGKSLLKYHRFGNPKKNKVIDSYIVDVDFIERIK